MPDVVVLFDTVTWLLEMVSETASSLSLLWLTKKCFEDTENSLEDDSTAIALGNE